MDHDEAASLLGAYALDAVESDEAVQIEEHLADCPRCRAELRAHREVAAALGNSGATAPEGLWERIAAEVEGDDAPPAPPAVGLFKAPVQLSRYRWRKIGPALGAVAAAAIVVLGFSVSHLDHQLNGLQRATAARGLAPAVAATALGPHQVVTLTSTVTSRSASIEIAPDGHAYWVGSSLGTLPAGRTYQLWAKVGDQFVSIALIGPDPRSYAAFRVSPAMKALLVTDEPAAGVAQPTTPVLVSGRLATLA